MPYLIAILLLLLLLIAVLVLRALILRAPQPSPASASSASHAPQINRDKIASDMSAMIQCQTVSNKDAAKENDSEFQKFKTVLRERFPLIHAHCQYRELGRRGLLYHWAAATATGSAKPRIFMSHYDVVPVESAAWSRDPFGGELIDDEIWGRGTLDTKGTLLGIMEAAEMLLDAGYAPKQDLYFAFSGDEEIFGPSAPAIVDYFATAGIEPEMVLDEGGAVVEKPLPGVFKDAAVVGIAEKGIANIRVAMKSTGGHASTPPRRSTAARLAQAILKLEKVGFKPRLSFPVEQMLLSLAKEGRFGLRLVAANLWFFKPLLFFAAKRMGGELSALLRTTIAVTQLEGSEAINVMPPEVACGLNLRILPGETRASALVWVKDIVSGLHAEVSIIGGDGFGSEPSRVSTLDAPAWEMLQNTIRETWPDTTVAPYLMLAGSDSRHYGRISDKVYRFSAMKLSKAERGLIHSHDERVPLDTLCRCVTFYWRLMQA